MTELEEVLDLLKVARGNLARAAYHELGEHLYGVAEASIEGTIATIEAIVKLQAHREGT